MRFIIDAQLPIALSKYLEKKGFDVIHTVESSSPNQKSLPSLQKSAFAFRVNTNLIVFPHF